MICGAVWSQHYASLAYAHKISMTLDVWFLTSTCPVPNIRFPEEHMASLNKTPPEKFIHVAPQYGEGVLGFLNVFHQLHCLVSLCFDVGKLLR